MKTRGWLAGALVAGGVVFAMRGCLTQESAPDERLAGRFEAMCEIARDHVDSPVQGVRKLGRYLGKHAGDLFGEWGATLAEIERIPDDRKHDDRARIARERLRKPVRVCERDWMRFGQAVEGNPEAKALVERFNIRLNRTIEIIFAGGQRFDFLKLPAELDRAIETTLR